MAKKNTFRYTNAARKARKKSKKRVKVNSELLASVWDQKQSLAANFKGMGLSHDPNKTLKIKQKQFFSADSEENDSVEIAPINHEVIETLEYVATSRKPVTRQIGADDGNLCKYMLELYEDDYEAMQRDSANVYQHTANQLKKLIARFKSTKHYDAYLAEKQSGKVNIVDQLRLTV